jgi:hypothetical protein
VQDIFDRGTPGREAGRAASAGGVVTPLMNRAKASMLIETARMMHQAGGTDLEGARAAAGGVVTKLVDQVKAQTRELEQFNDPRGLYARLPLEFLLR